MAEKEEKSNDFSLTAVKETQNNDYFGETVKAIKGHSIEDQVGIISNIMGQFRDVVYDEKQDSGLAGSSNIDSYNKMAEAFKKNEPAKNAQCADIHQGGVDVGNAAGLHLTLTKCGSVDIDKPDDYLGLHSTIIGTDSKGEKIFSIDYDKSKFIDEPSVIKAVNKAMANGIDTYNTGTTHIQAPDGRETAHTGYNLPGKNHDKTTVEQMSGALRQADNEKPRMETLENVLSTDGILKSKMKKLPFQFGTKCEYSYGKGESSYYGKYKNYDILTEGSVKTPLKIGTFTGQGSFSYANVNSTIHTQGDAGWGECLTEKKADYNVQDYRARFMYATPQASLLNNNLKLRGFLNGEAGKYKINFDPKTTYTHLDASKSQFVVDNRQSIASRDSFGRLSVGGSAQLGSEDNYIKAAGYVGIGHVLTQDVMKEGWRKDIFNNYHEFCFGNQKENTAALKINLAAGGDRNGLEIEGFTGGSYTEYCKKIVQEGNITAVSKVNDFTFKLGGGAQREVVTLKQFPGKAGVDENHKTFIKSSIGFKGCSLNSMIENPTRKHPVFRSNITLGF